MTTRAAVDIGSNSILLLVVSGSGETCFIYGENFGDLLNRKITLMEKYRNVEPRIDHEIIWKV